MVAVASLSPTSTTLTITTILPLTIPLRPPMVLIRSTRLPVVCKKVLQWLGTLKFHPMRCMVGECAPECNIHHHHHYQHVPPSIVRVSVGTFDTPLIDAGNNDRMPVRWDFVGRYRPKCVQTTALGTGTSAGQRIPTNEQQDARAGEIYIARAIAHRRWLAGRSMCLMEVEGLWHGIKGGLIRRGRSCSCSCRPTPG